MMVNVTGSHLTIAAEFESASAEFAAAPSHQRRFGSRVHETCTVEKQGLSR